MKVFGVALFTGLLAAMLCGCISRPAPSTVYMLEPMKTVANGQAVNLPGLVMVMPVRLPPQLKQRGIMVEQDGDRPKVLVGHLWAGPLDEQVGANLVSNLQKLLQSPDVALYPGPRYAKPAFQVETEINRFSGDNKSFHLRAVSTISDPNARRILSRRSVERTLPVKGGDANAYVDAASAALAELSRDVVANLAALSRSPHPNQSPKAPAKDAQ